MKKFCKVKDILVLTAENSWTCLVQIAVVNLIAVLQLITVVIYAPQFA